MRGSMLITLVLASVTVFGQDFQARQQHVAAALAALKVEQAKEGHDCAQAKNQYDDTMCTTEVAQAAYKNLATFYDNLKAILGNDNGLQVSQKRGWNTASRRAMRFTISTRKEPSATPRRRAVKPC